MPPEKPDEWLPSGALPETWATSHVSGRSVLEALLGSRARAAVATELFSDPGVERHLGALARSTGFAVPTLRKALAPWVAAGVLNARHDGNRLALRANAEHAAFEPLLGLIRATTGAGAVLRELVLPDARIELALLFGSLATADWDRRSDVDLLLVGSLSLTDAVDLVRSAEKRLHREVNPVVYSPEEFTARRLARDPFVTRMLASKVVTLKGTLSAE